MTRSHAALTPVLALAVLLVIMCESDVANANNCLTATAAQSQKEIKKGRFVCALPIASNTSSASLPNFACAETAAQARKDACGNNATCPCCYMVTDVPGDDKSFLNVQSEFVSAAGYFSNQKVRLHKSVSVMVAASKVLGIKGSAIAEIDSGVFYDVGESPQIEKLVTIETSVNYFDFGALKPLKNLKKLDFINNANLTKMINYEKVDLSELASISFVGILKALVNCKNFASLPQSVTKLLIIDVRPSFGTVLNASCVLCSLSPGVKQVGLDSQIRSIAQFPGAKMKAGAQPYPLPDLDIIQFGYSSYQMYHTFNITGRTATGCGECGISCDPWTTTAAPAPTKAVPEAKPKASETGSNSKSISSTDGSSSGSMVRGSSVAAAAALVTAIGAAAIW